MLRPEHPEILTREWLPPILIARNSALDQLRRWMTGPVDDGEGTRAACVLGPPGSGSSAVAHRAAVDVVDTVRREDGGPAPLLVRVHVRWCSGAQGVAGELLRRFDAGFDPRGFPVAEIMAGFLRRVVREGRPVVIVLDDIGPDAPDLSRVVRALVAPTRFLPEGVNVAPRIWLILAGATEAEATWGRVHRSGVPIDHRVLLPPPGPKEVEAIVRDRAGRALGRPPPEAWIARVVDRTVGLSVARAVERLQHELADPLSGSAGTASPARDPAPSIEQRILLALEQLASNGPVALHELRAAERRSAIAEGVRPMPTTTFWRRIVRLESAGVIRREVRPGGRGGTLSRLELLRPVTGWGGPTWGNPRAAALDAHFAGVGEAAPLPAHAVGTEGAGLSGPRPG